jgi:biotin operon repressor
MSDDLLAIFKALSDANRLKMLGLLARRAYSGEELAALLDLKPSTVSHHLARLAAVGLVSARAEGYYSMYQLDEAALQRTRLLFSKDDLLSAVDEIDMDAYDQKVIRDFARSNGSLKEIPAQRKKLDAVLRYIVASFEPGQRYSEKQVNALLARFHPDTASMRRELIASRLMDRQPAVGEYWRLEDTLPPGEGGQEN